MDEGCGEVLPIRGQRRYAMKMTPSCYLDCRHDRDDKNEYDDDDDDYDIDNTDSKDDDNKVYQHGPMSYLLCVDHLYNLSTYNQNGKYVQWLFEC